MSKLLRQKDFSEYQVFFEALKPNYCGISRRTKRVSYILVSKLQLHIKAEKMLKSFGLLSRAV